MPGYFDVKTLPPYSEDCIATRSINLMCALMRNVTYGQLYCEEFWKPGGCALDQIIENVNTLHPDLLQGATSAAPVVKTKLAGPNGAFEKIRKTLSKNGKARVMLGKAFYTERQPSPGCGEFQLINRVVNTLEGVHAPRDDQMYHFCVPFRGIQFRRIPHGKQPPKETEFTSVMNVLSGKTMQDFYEKPYTDEERKAVIAARKWCIFRELRPAGSRPPVLVARGREGNKKRCGGSHCIDSLNEDDWCNMVTFPDGTKHCALGSD